MRITRLTLTLAVAAVMAGGLGCGPEPTLGVPERDGRDHGWRRDAGRDGVKRQRQLLARPLAGNELYPYTAEVIRDGVTSKMLAPRQAGENDCNSCHFWVGLNAAPGRITLP